MSVVQPLPENEGHESDGRFKKSFNAAGRGERGQSGAMAVVSLIVALTVGAIIAAYLLPLGVEEIANASLGEDASEGATSIWGILDVMIVLAVFLFFVSIALAAADRV